MVLESTMICVDDSDWMRNGDFLPSRLQAQEDAVNVICRAKQQESPENTFGVSTLTSGKVLVTLTNQMGKVTTRLHHVQPDGTLNFVVGVRIAQLALRHRKSKNSKMRIVAFVGSPLVESDGEMKKLAMRLKKENVSIDIVNFGELDANTEKLETFIKSVNGSKADAGSHLVTVPATTSQLSDALMTSPIIGASGNYSAGAPGGGGHGDFDFGVDPSQDPELAMALRVSMEEERNRRQADQRPDDSTAAAPAAAAPAPAEGDASSGGDLATQLSQFGGMSEDEELMLALQMSMETQGADSAGAGGDTAMDSDAALAQELMAQDVAAAAAAPEPMDDEEYDDDGLAAALADPDVLRSVLSTLPGVDMQSESIQQVLSETAAEFEAREGDEKDGEDAASDEEL